jgi:hypothetical protein
MLQSAPVAHAHTGLLEIAMRRTAVCFFLISLSLLVACSRKPSDQKIAADIQKTTADDPIAQGSQVQVSSSQGKVTLTGNAKSSEARDQIERIAHQEPGVTGVDDQTSLDYSDLAPTSTSAPAQPAPQQAPTPAPTIAQAPPPPPPPPPQPIVVPAGTTLTVRTSQTLSSKTSQAGAVFHGSTMSPIRIGGEVVIPAGSEVVGIVKQAKKAGKIKGAAVLSLALESVTIDGHTYNIATEAISQTSTGKGKRSAAVIGGGTGLGAVIGGIAGGGKGAAIGALVGAGAGTVGAATTGNREIELPAESALSFKLAQPLTLKPV